MARRRRAPIVVALALLLVPAPFSSPDPSAPDAPAPDPPAADSAALAGLPVGADAVPGARAVGPCPPGVAPTALDAFGGGAAGDAGPGALVDPGTAGAGVTVAVVDTGVAPHPRLAGRVLDGGDFVAGRSGLDDCDGHGTVVAGLLAAAPSPTDLLEGLVPGARVLAVRQTSTWVVPPGAGAAGDVATLARAVRSATRPEVSVMTLALTACVAPVALADPVLAPALGALRAAVRDAVDRGVVVVAAAGSVGVPGGCAAPDAAGRAAALPVPGWFADDVLTVGAAQDGRADPTSLPGPWVDVVAPGRAGAGLDARGAGLTVALTVPDAAPSPLVGSSIAVARVAGTAAAIRVREPGLPAREVAARIARTARPAGPGTGAGEVDAAAALADRPTAPPPPPTPDTTGVVLAGAGGGLLALGAVLLARRAHRHRGATG